MMHDVAITPDLTDPKDRFAALLEAHRGIVGKVAFTYARSSHDRDDLTQEIAAELWRSYARYDQRRPFATWAYRVALNVAITHLRRTARRTTEPLAADLAAPEPRGPDDRVGALRAVMESLAPLDRALLILYLDGRSYAEIADVLGISETNVATKIGRLKQALRRDITAHEPSERSDRHGHR